MNNDSVGDLLLSVGKNPHIDEASCRVFIYLFSKFLNNPGSKTIVTAPEDNYKDIGITFDSYKKSSDILLEQKIMRREQLENGQEIWEFNI